MEEVRIDVAALTTELEKMTVTDGLISSPGYCIFRVPKILSRHNTKAYEPNAFSIGPFHHGKPHLQRSQAIKAKYLNGLISRGDSLVIRDLVETVSEIEDKARDCYADNINMSRDDFVKLVVLDGCFLVELFLRNAYADLRETPNDPIFGALYQTQLLNHDLILLENQIPWMVLDRLFGLTIFPDNSKSLIELALEFFKDHSCFSPEKQSNLPPSEAKHILDLLRSSMVSSFKPTKSGHFNANWDDNMPSASSLDEAGIKFKIRRDPESILTVKFNSKKGVLEIPTLVIHEGTEPLFRNIISFEQCQPGCEGVVTSYAIMLDNLINTPEDLRILCKNKVIRNWLNAEDATKLFNQLYDDTYVKQLYYAALIKNVNDYCERQWPKYRTVLMRDYFKHPWSLISVIAATILLTLAFVQTYFTIPK